MLLDVETLVDQETYLGPASVVQTAAGRVQLNVRDDRRWARMGLAFPYEPVRGDEVLVIGRGEALYVIGVLRGSGPTTFSAPKDLRFRAPHGSIELTAANGVRVKASTVKLVSDTLEILATTLFERLVEATHWIENALHIRAGQVRMRSEASYDLRAAAISQRATEDVHVDGRKIHLG